VFASVSWGEPAWGLSLNQLGVVRSNAVRHLQLGEVGRDVVQKELAVVFSYFHLLVLAIVGEGVCNDFGVVFVDDVVLGVSSGEDDGSTHGDPGMEEGGCGYILVVYQSFVDSVEGSVHDDLTDGVVSFGVDTGFSRRRSR